MGEIGTDENFGDKTGGDRPREHCTVNKQIIFGFIMFNDIFNNISVILWRLVLLVEEIGVPRENHRHTASYWQTLSHNGVSSTPRPDRDSNSQD